MATKSFVILVMWFCALIFVRLDLKKTFFRSMGSLGFSSLLVGTVLGLYSSGVGAAVKGDSDPSSSLTVYSSRQEHLIKPIFEQYTKETGVKINYVTDNASPLIVRLEAEGAKTPADLFLTVDAGNLWLAAEKGLLEPVQSKVLAEQIPAHLRDPEHRWFGLSVRARAIVYHTKKVKPSELKDYRDLGNTKWHGRLCLRTSKKIYNQSLVAMMMAEVGSDQAEKTVQQWVKNLATDVFSSDTKLIEAMERGTCDVGIVNSYYLGRLQKEGKAQDISLFFPKDQDGGVHVNISGMGVVKHSQHKEEAQKLLEWLSKPEAQELFAKVNLEYPADPHIALDPIVSAWGTLTPNKHNLEDAGKLQKQAIMLMDRAGYK